MKTFKTEIKIIADILQKRIYHKPVPYDYDSERDNYDKSTKGHKSKKSLNRAKSSIIDIVNCNVGKYSKFITLTLNRENENATREELIEYFKYFKKQYKKHFKEYFKYLGVIEKQFKRKKKYNLENAPLHFHLVVFNEKKLDFQTLKKCWPYGSIDIKKIDSVYNLGIYIAKYLTKESLQLNSKAYFTSRNIKKPIIYKDQDAHIINDNYTFCNEYNIYFNDKDGQALDANKVYFYEWNPKKNGRK